MCTRRLGRALGAALLVLGLAAGARADGEPSPGTGPGEEPPLEGEAKKAHEAEVKRILADLRAEKNQELVAGQISRLAAAGTRAGRDALIAFATGNKNHEYVKKAFEALARIGGKVAVDWLCGKNALRSKDFLVQLSAVEALGEEPSPLAVGPILDVMGAKSTKTEVVGAAAQALTKIAPTDERVVEAVFALAEHKKDTIRSHAIEALGRFKTDRAVARATAALREDPNTRVRASGAKSLQNTGRRDVIPVLEEALRTETAFTVKDAVQTALRWLEDEASGR